MNTEKAFKTMQKAGIMNITLGIIVLVASVASGVLMIINGARLLVHKNDVVL